VKTELQKNRRVSRLLIRTVCTAVMLALCLSGTALAAALKSGSSGPEVTEIQNRLTELGYYAQPVTRTYDSATKAAVKLFQKANGLSASGTAYDSTQKKLSGADCVTYAQYIATMTLSQGDKGDGVVMIQRQLNGLGYYNGEIDGVFNTAVRTAVKEFQTANAIKASGKATSATRELLNSGRGISLNEYNQIRELKYGAKGDAVLILQNQLAKLGYYAGEADGKYDSDVKSAVKEFQTANSLKGSGSATKETRALLNSGKGISLAEYDKVREVKSGAKGNAVVIIQQQLTGLGYYVGDIDGKFDSELKQAVVEFQQANGMKGSGKADIQTRTLLNAGSGVRAETYYRICALKTSSKGPAVIALQKQLTEMGFYDGALDGKYSADVRTAVKYFQTANGIRATGTADAATRARMNAENCVTGKTYNLTCALKYGSKGTPVKALQRRLRDLGYFAGEIDGKYGSALKTAVKTFQTASSLKVTGTADENTRTVMNAQEAVTKAEYDQVRPVKSGEKGDAVIIIQSQLKKLGYFTYEIDGKYSSKVRTAVKTFQTANELKETGTADVDTRKLLNSGKGVTAAEYDEVRPLKSGDKGEAVRMLQTQLSELGYFVYSADGKYSSATKNAVAVLQTANGIKSTGKADVATRRLINSGKAVSREAYDASRDLKKGEVGSTVRAVQNRLIALGYYDKIATGVYDSATRTAVKLFQKAHGLKETGNADVSLRKLMFGQEALSFSEYEKIRPVKSGEKGEAVRLIQQQLKSLGYFTDAIDGKYGSALKKAVKLFYEAHGMDESSSKVSAEMRSLLNGGKAVSLSVYYWTTPVRNGDKGETVVKLQQRLTELGYYTDSVNGRYGSDTVSAVQLFQLANGLEVTGEADTKTREVMNSDQAITKAKYDEGMNGIDDETRAERIEKLIAIAKSKLGCPYVHITHGPDTFDCSGFTSYVFGQVGIDISTASYNQGYMDKLGKPYKAKLTSYSELQRGDLLVFDTNKDDGDLSDHLGIYLGDGTFIHASSTRKQVVISNLIPYGNFSWAFRLI